MTLTDRLAEVRQDARQRGGENRAATTCPECEADLPDGGPCPFCEAADAAGVVNGRNADDRERRRDMVEGYQGQTPTVTARCGACDGRTRVLATAVEDGTAFDCDGCGALNILSPGDGGEAE